MDPAQRLFTTRTYSQVHYFPITKCGCTYVKNLFWKIDHGAQYDEPLRVHRGDSAFPRATDFGYTAETVRRMEHSFVILRDPVERFLSLYFDKVIGPGAQRFIPLRRVLAEGYGLDPQPRTLAGHRRNTLILADWIARNLSGPSELRRDPHWRPQAERMEVIRALDLKILPLERIGTALPLLLSPVIPGIADLLRGLERNSAPQPVSRADLATPDLRGAILDLYAEDARITGRLAQHWAGQEPASGADFPRFSTLFGE